MFQKLLFTFVVAAISGIAATSAFACGGSSGASASKPVVTAPPTTANSTTITRRYSYDPGISAGSYRVPRYQGSSRGQFNGIRGADAKVRGQY